MQSCRERRKMRVLLAGCGATGHVGGFFLKALQELGHDHRFIELSPPQRFPIVHKVASRVIGRRPLAYWKINWEMCKTVKEFSPQVVIISMGNWISSDTLREIRAPERCIVNFATDDPFNPVVSRPSTAENIPLYDLYACTKRAIMEDVRQAGCGHVVFLPFGYEPSLHFFEPASVYDSSRYASGVAFVGGADQDRRPMFRRLHRAVGGELALYGGFWNRDPVLRKYYRGFAVGRAYRLALCGAKIGLGLVRRANRDGHSMRTFEIPACGTFMLAERTEEHAELFEEDRDVAYFGSDEELVDKVRFYLGHEEERVRMARAAYERVVAGCHTYTDRMRAILKLAAEFL